MQATNAAPMLLGHFGGQNGGGKIRRKGLIKHLIFQPFTTSHLVIKKNAVAPHNLDYFRVLVRKERKGTERIMHIFFENIETKNKRTIDTIELIFQVLFQKHISKLGKK